MCDVSDFDKSVESAAIDDVATALYEIDGAIREARNLTYCGACGKGFPNAHLDHKCLRDEFAMAALPQLMAGAQAMVVGGLQFRDEVTADDIRKAIAGDAYHYADAMLEARKPRATDDKIAAALADAAQARIAEMKKT